MSDGTESMFETEPESSWNPLFAFSGGGSGDGGKDMVNLESGAGNSVDVAGNEAKSSRAIAGEIGTKTSVLTGRFTVGQDDMDKDDMQGRTSAEPTASRSSPTETDVPAATSSMSDPLANNRTTVADLRQRAQEYPATNKGITEATSPLENRTPKTPVITPALSRGVVEGQQDVLRNLNSDFGLVPRNGGRIGGIGFSIEGSSNAAVTNETQTFGLSSANASTSGGQSAGASVPGVPSRNSPLDVQAAAPNGGIKKKKAARARVGDLLPENIHCCPFEGCNKKFAKKYNLKIHVRRHAGDLPFQCELPNCQKRFMWHSSFQRHQRSHLRKPKQKRKKIAGAGDSDAAPSSVAKLDASMIPSQLLMGNGTGPELPESILSALVSAGGGSPFDESSALHSAQLFCTGPALELGGPVYDPSALRPEQKQHRITQQGLNQATAQQPHRVENNQLTINDYTTISAIESTAQNLKAAAKSNQLGGSGIHQSAPPYSHLSTPCGIESNSRNVSASMRMMPTQALPSSAHTAPGSQLFSTESDLSRLFSPISNADALGLNFLHTGLNENHGSTSLNNVDIPTSEILPPSTFPETSSPTSGISVPIVAKKEEESESGPSYNVIPEQTQPSGTSPGQAEFGVENFDESLAFLLDSIREPIRD